MDERYEDIVRKWYYKLRPEFLRQLTAQYSSLTLEDAENLYQDAFLAVQENIKRGSIKENTSWRSYILKIGMNLAGHEWRQLGRFESTDSAGTEDDRKALNSTAYKVERKIQELDEEDDSLPLWRNTEALSILGHELEFFPDPCKSIVERFYYDGKSMKEIAEEFGYSGSDTVKTIKNRCMNKLKKRIMQSLSRAQILN